MKRGLLELLVWVTPSNSQRPPDCALLLARGAPVRFAAAAHAPDLWDVDLGDESCEAVPQSVPTQRGLWVLRWAWQEVPSQFDTDSTVARYDTTCEWLRPSTDDLVRLEALPEEEEEEDDPSIEVPAASLDYDGEDDNGDDDDAGGAT